MKLSNANSILICTMVLLTCIFMANPAMAGVCGGTPCVDSSDVINDSLTGSDINSMTSVDIDSLTVSDTVGIGTSSPEGTLHLIPSNDEAIIIGDGTIETADHNNSITFTEVSTGDGDNGIRWLDGDGNLNSVFYGSPQTSGVFIGTNNSGSIRFGVSSTQTGQIPERMRITVDGRVGIGTTTPRATLDVNGFVKLAVNSSAPVTCQSNKDGSIALTSGYRLCVCDGSDWVFASDGSTACQW